MDKDDLRELHKARSYAGWSFLGIAIPLIGWILGLLSLSTLKYVVAHSEKAARRIKEVRVIAYWGIILSTIVFALGIAVSIWAYDVQKKEAEAQRVNQLQKENEAREAAERETQATNLRRYMLATCLDNVDKWYRENDKNVTTVFQQQNLLEQQRQEINKCQIQYAD